MCTGTSFSIANGDGFVVPPYVQRLATAPLQRGGGVVKNRVGADLDSNCFGVVRAIAQLLIFLVFFFLLFSDRVTVG